MNNYTNQLWQRLTLIEWNIGFDQIIFIEKQREDSYPITIYNSDGGEVSACGNGARCVAYLLSENLNTKKIQIKTNNRLLNAKIVGDFQVKSFLKVFVLT